MGFDIIGDIHGQAGKLEALFRKLGYVRKAAGWAPPQGRQAVFLGDLIDRGPEQIKVVRIVRSMIEAGHARSVMGNHEWNALGFAMPRRGKPGEFLRQHNARNLALHEEFLRQVGSGTPLHKEMLEWFRSLPPTLDLGGIRVVHAWWHQPYVDLVNSRLASAGRIDDEFLHAAFAKGSPEWDAMEGLTKGLEIRLPTGHSFRDHTGTMRAEVRARWWHAAPRTFRDVAIVDDDQKHLVPDQPLPAAYRGGIVEGTPVFIGHYWMTGTPALQSPGVACVDYSAARDGPLVAYRWEGEAELDATRFVQAGIGGE